MTGYIEVINASAPHIYHSALVFTPQKSVVRKLYESYAHPFTRVVLGLPISWDANTAATTRPSVIDVVAWSPYDRFIAIAWFDTMTIEVLDSATLQRLQTLRFPQELDRDTVDRALAFSPDSRILTLLGTHSWHTLVVWDLQTGGVASAIRWIGPSKDATGKASITYSANGTMVGVRCRYAPGGDVIRVFDVASSIRGVHSHSPTSPISHTNGIWTHGESLRFTTIDMKTITIWEVGFTSDAIPTEVETLPAPEDVNFRDWDKDQECVQFLPAAYRLALAFQRKVSVWDARNAKYLLHCTDPGFHSVMSFSSDGRFFACATVGFGFYLWKESPTGYILHEILAPNIMQPRPLLSRTGQSIVELDGFTIRLLHTKDSTTPPSNPLTQSPHQIGSFLLDFSPDGMLAAVARERSKTVTVLNLKSGVPRLTIDAGMEVEGHGVIGNAIAVIGDWKVVTWDLPTGNRVPGAKMTLEDSARTIDLRDPPRGIVFDASISPDSWHVALTVLEQESMDVLSPSDCDCLYIYDGSTGEQLMRRTPSSDIPFFAPGGCDLWLVDHDGYGKVLRVGDGGQVLQGPEGRVDIEHPPEGYPWASSLGYRVTDDWWILGPDGKRLLMLPPPWQYPRAVLRVWKGQFLALLHGKLPEPVILELNR